MLLKDQSLLYNKKSDINRGCKKYNECTLSLSLTHSRLLIYTSVFSLSKFMHFRIYFIFSAHTLFLYLPLSMYKMQTFTERMSIK